MEAAKSEDALAAVIAHEIAHVQLSHGLRAIEAGCDVQEWVNKFNISGAQTIADRLNNGFSQIQEFDADITALSLLAATGYRPSSLPEMLKELAILQNKRTGGFNKTHPSPASRLVDAKVAEGRYATTADKRANRQKRFASVKK